MSKHDQKDERDPNVKQVKNHDLLEKEAALRDEHHAKHVGDKSDETKTPEELEREEQERNRIKPPDSPHIVPTNNADPPPMPPSPSFPVAPSLQPGVTYEQAVQQQNTNNQQSQQDPPGSKNIPYEPGKPGQPQVGQQGTQPTEPDKTR